MSRAADIKSLTVAVHDGVVVQMHQRLRNVDACAHQSLRRLRPMRPLRAQQRLQAACTSAART